MQRITDSKIKMLPFLLWSIMDGKMISISEYYIFSPNRRQQKIVDRHRWFTMNENHCFMKTVKLIQQNLFTHSVW